MVCSSLLDVEYPYPFASLQRRLLHSVSSSRSETYSFSQSVICSLAPGPCIRISPREVHIDSKIDPSFWESLYTNSTKLDKDRWYYDGFGAGLSTVSPGPSELHRARRGAMGNYFSISNVRKHEPMVLEYIEKLCSRIEEHQATGRVLYLYDAYRALATDVVTAFVLPEPRKHLALPGFAKDFSRLMRFYARLITLQRHFKAVHPLLFCIPDWLTIRMDSSGGSIQMVEMQHIFQRQTELAAERKGVLPGGQEPSILDAIISSTELHERDKAPDRVYEEARNTIGAGTETTGVSLSVLTYRVLPNPNVHRRLQAELHEAASISKSLLDIRVLGQLPYLQACINKALRIACPVTGRLPRVNPRAPIGYTDPNGKTYAFPPGTVISMSMPDLHFNSDVFQDPHTYIPERWIDSDLEKKTKMQQCFVPFGKGSMNCIGINLAKIELTLTVGNLFNKYDFELFETTERDLSRAQDWFSPFPPLDSAGLRVVVH